MMASSGSHSGGSIKSVPQDEICRELEKESTSVGTSSGSSATSSIKTSGVRWASLSLSLSAIYLSGSNKQKLLVSFESGVA